jgi:hypothetical protein
VTSDRYDPLPGLTEIPAFLVHKLSPRALVDYPAGRFTYCKVSGRPGEGSLRESPVRVPAACGGATPGGVATG